MKTVFITISRGSMARNFLQNDFYKLLRDKCQIVILTPADKDERFIENFAHKNVKFINTHEKCHGRAESIMVSVHKLLIYNKIVGLRLKYGIKGATKPEDLSRLRYYLLTIIFKPLSRLRFLRDWARWIDHVFFQKSEVMNFEKLIEEEKPSLIFSTHPTSGMEAALVKAAKNQKVKVWVMPKSWDNLSKAGFRAKADKMILWSEFMEEQAMNFQNYKKEQIEKIGVPQFDYYFDKNRIWTREEFCKKYGLDVNKKIILFCSEGKVTPQDSEMTSMIHEFIHKNQLNQSSQLLIRPHYGYRDDEKKFSHLLEKDNVRVDLSHTPSRVFADQWDYSTRHMDRFLNSLYHAEIVITTCSTIALDASCFDKPVISIRFDGDIGYLPYAQSIRWNYESDYYAEVVKTGATVLADSKEGLKDLINRYLDNPALEREERQELVRRFCNKIDGNSGKRLFELVLKECRIS